MAISDIVEKIIVVLSFMQNSTQASILPLPLENKSETKCWHCGLAVPVSRVVGEKENSEKFCCNGCEYVYQIIHNLGLEDFYKIKNILPEGKNLPALPQQSSFAQFDDSEFEESYAIKFATHSSISFYLEGMHCAACVWLIEKLPEVLTGVSSSRVDFGLSNVTILYDSEKIKLSQIAQTLDSLGYTPYPQGSSQLAELKKKEDRTFLLRLAVAGVCAGNTMMLAVSLYQGLFTGIESKYSLFFQWVSFVLTIPAIFYSAVPFYRAAWGGLKLKMLHIDLPISLGIVTGFIASFVNTVIGSPHVYYDTICTLIFVMLVGRWLQRKSVDRFVNSKEIFFSIVPLAAMRIMPQGIEEVFAGSLKIGDKVLVNADQGFPGDGLVISGTSQVDTAMLTGESVPIKVGLGDFVYAGTKNISADLEIEITQAHRQTRIGKLLEAIEINKKKAKISQATDVISSYFVFAVLILASGTALYFSITADIFIALDRTLALLVITCPCALGLSAPLALSSGVRQASRLGIFFNGEDVIEKFSKVKKFFFDKTGTLTVGDMRVVDSREFVTEQKDSSIIPWAIEQLEESIQHPVARALRSYAKNKIGNASQNEFQLREIKIHQGQGVEGFDDAGNCFRLGSWRWLESFISGELSNYQNYFSELVGTGISVVALVKNQQVLAIFGVGDRLRDDAVNVIANLQKRNFDLQIISGDIQQIVDRVGKELKIAPEKLQGELTPENKQTIVRTSQESSMTAMVGDGVNDTACIKEAGVGIAVSGGAEASLRAADIYLADPELNKIVVAYDGCKKTMSIIHRNLTISLIYNLFGAVAAITGYINPLVAAVLMPLSSIAVVVSSVSAKSFRENFKKN
jgi:Cu2+-exporting ATPase